MRYAFVHKNFRELNFERKAIFVSHALTVLFCWFPWFNQNEEWAPGLNYNAFSGPGWLIGVLILVISLLAVIYFLDRMLESEKVSLPVSENTLFFVVGAQQILLIILAWSVIFSLSRQDADVTARFGIFLALIAQVTALVATFLNYQLEKQSQVRAFFDPNDNVKPE